MAKKEKKQQETDKPIVFYTQELKKSKTINEDTVKIITFIIVLIVVLGLLVLLYFLNGKYVTKDIDKTTTTTTTTEATYNDSQTTVSTMFNISKKDTYYVLAYDSEDEIVGQYLYSNATTANIENVKVYTLDLANAMNQKYYDSTKEPNTKPTKPSEVSFKTNTLLVFKKGKVVEFITDKDQITKKLQNKTSK